MLHWIASQIFLKTKLLEDYTYRACQDFVHQLKNVTIYLEPSTKKSSFYGLSEPLAWNWMLHCYETCTVRLAKMLSFICKEELCLMVKSRILRFHSLMKQSLTYSAVNVTKYIFIGFHWDIAASYSSNEIILGFKSLRDLLHVQQLCYLSRKKKFRFMLEDNFCYIDDILTTVYCLVADCYIILF